MFITRKLTVYQAKWTRWVAQGRIPASSKYWEVIRVSPASGESLPVPRRELLRPNAAQNWDSSGTRTDEHPTPPSRSRSTTSSPSPLFPSTSPCRSPLQRCPSSLSSNKTSTASTKLRRGISFSVRSTARWETTLSLDPSYALSSTPSQPSWRRSGSYRSQCLSSRCSSARRERRRHGLRPPSKPRCSGRRRSRRWTSSWRASLRRASSTISEVGECKLLSSPLLPPPPLPPRPSLIARPRQARVSRTDAPGRGRCEEIQGLDVRRTFWYELEDALHAQRWTVIPSRIPRCEPVRAFRATQTRRCLLQCITSIVKGG
jgi:hypothetical protein